MALNQEQKVLKKNLLDFIKSGDTLFIINGYAGTGKTYVVAEFINDVLSSSPETKIFVTAPTNKAVKVLDEKISHANLVTEKKPWITKTLHKYLGINVTLNEKTLKSEQDLTNLSLGEVKGTDILIIDECSMVSLDIFKLVYLLFGFKKPDIPIVFSENKKHEAFNNEANRLFVKEELNEFEKSIKGIVSGKKVIVMGDFSQLPPINEPSSMFAWYTPGYVLKQVVRQANSILLDYTQSVRRLTEEKTYYKDNKPQYNSKFRNYINNVSQKYKDPKILKFYNSSDSFIRKFKRMFDSNRIEDLVILCFHNNRVQEYNNRIRAIIHGEKAVNTSYVCNDIIMFCKNHNVYNFQNQCNHIFHNSDTFRVISSLTEKENITFGSLVPRAFTFHEVFLETTCQNGCRVSIKIISEKDEKSYKHFLKEAKDFLKLNRSKAETETNEKYEKVLTNFSKAVAKGKYPQVSLFSKKKIPDIVKTRTSIGGKRCYKYTFSRRQASKEEYVSMVTKAIEEFKKDDLLMRSSCSSAMMRYADLFNKYNDFKSRKDLISYAYAMTVHKSQGSTFKYCFVDLFDIGLNNSDELHRMFYTAVSRCREGLFQMRYDFESITRQILQQLFDAKFPCVRPDFLYGLELDGYCQSLGVAFEYNGIQHYQYHRYFHKSPSDFIKQHRNDKRKYEICANRGIKLIIIDSKELVGAKTKKERIRKLFNIIKEQISGLSTVVHQWSEENDEKFIRFMCGKFN